MVYSARESSVLPETGSAGAESSRAKDIRAQSVSAVALKSQRKRSDVKEADTSSLQLLLHMSGSTSHSPRL